MQVLSATAHHVTAVRLGGQIHISDENTNNLLGVVDLVRGFAVYTGVRGSAHEGMSATVRGGLDGLIAALDQGLLNGRDDRS
jgi:hypothetical protein